MSGHDHSSYVTGCYRCERSLDESINASRRDAEFMARIKQRVIEDKPILDALAASEQGAPK